jgi:hypothetical protein
MVMNMYMYAYKMHPLNADDHFETTHIHTLPDFNTSPVQSLANKAFRCDDRIAPVRRPHLPSSPSIRRTTSRSCSLPLCLSFFCPSVFLCLSVPLSDILQENSISSETADSQAFRVSFCKVQTSSCCLRIYTHTCV